MKTCILILSIVIFSSCTGCKKQTAANSAVTTPGDAELETTVLNQSLTYPWEITWGPDNKIWMTERGGKISRVDPLTGSATTVLTISDMKSTGEGGLLGMALHPDFATTPEVFVTFDYDRNGIYTAKVVKYTFNGTTLVNPVVLLDNVPAAGIHNGSRIVFSPDKKLFVSFGDASVSAQAQNPNSFSGKILRLNTDGSIPADNPDPLSPVWTLGHRNPQGLVFVGNKLYSSEHGNSTDDEVNLITKGKNYGWPNVEGFCNTSAERSHCTSLGVVEPLFAWSPTIAPSGIDYYNSDRIPQWKNSLLLAVLKNAVMVQLKLGAGGNSVATTNEYFKNDFGRLRDICVSPEGRVYMITSNGNNDKLIMIDKK